jgi:hypothetical protein
LETRDLATLALYAVGFGIAVACFVLNILSSVSVYTFVTLIAIGVFVLSAAGLKSTAGRSKK